MKKNKILFKIIDIIIFLISNLSIIYIILFNENEQYKLSFILPIFFEISYFLALRKCMKEFKEFGIVFTGISFIRYVILPSLIVFNGGYIGRNSYHPKVESFNLAFILMVYELIVSSIVIYYLTKKMNKNIESEKKIIGPKSLFIYFIFMGFVLTLLFLNKSIIKSISFIFPKETVFNYDDFNFLQQITIMGLMIVKQLIFIIGVYKCKIQYDKTNKRMFVIISVLLLIMNSVLYFGSNRSDFLLLLSASIIYWIIIFKKYNKIVISTVVILGVIIFLAITDVRQYASISNNKSKIIDYTDTIQTYTGGPYNVAVSIETLENFSKNGNIKTLLFDFARPTLGINLIAKQMNLKFSNLYFNYTLFGTNGRVSQIMPMIGEGYYCLGFAFSPIVEVIFICIAFKLKYIISKKTRIELIYFFTITMLRLGFVMGQNATIQMNDLSFNLFVPIILLWLNDKILLKRKYNEENK